MDSFIIDTQMLEAANTERTDHQPTVTKKPIGFSDFPAEIRTMIYDAFFNDIEDRVVLALAKPEKTSQGGSQVLVVAW